jgi:hypothetical protein
MRRIKLSGGVLSAVGVLAVAAVPFVGGLDASADIASARPHPPHSGRLTAAQLRIHPLAGAEKDAELKRWYEVATWNLEASRGQQSTGRRRSGGGGGGGTCAGSIPGNIIYRESKCDPNARNPSSGASGKYQVLDSTWDGYGGYGSAADAPESVQDQWAAEAYAQSGCDPWGGC